MALITLTARIANISAPDRTEPVELVVDSGAVCSVVRGDVLSRLAVSPDRRESFILANGERLERRVGYAMFYYEDRKGPALVVFGEAEDCPLLGFTTLENLGLMLDPLCRTVKPLPLLLM